MLFNSLVHVTVLLNDSNKYNNGRFVPDIMPLVSPIKPHKYLLSSLQELSPPSRALATTLVLSFSEIELRSNRFASL